MSDTISGTCRACGEPITFGEALPSHRAHDGSVVWARTAQCWHCDTIARMNVDVSVEAREEPGR